MTEWNWGYLVWGGNWILIQFFVYELVSKDVLGWAPWPSLSATTRHAIHTYPWVGYVLLGVFIGLVAHFFTQRHILPSIVYGVLVSLGIHMLDKNLP